MSENEIISKLAKATLEGDEVLAKQAAEEVIAANIDILKAIKEGLGKGMAEIGNRYKCFEVFLPELMLAAEAMNAGLDVLRPKLMEKKVEASKGKVVIGTVFGDIHDLGKNLVSAFLSVGGYEVFDIGKSVSPQDFVKKAEEVGANIIAMSCLISPSMYYQKDVIALLKAMGIREKYYVIVGGGPITPEWTGEIGADGYARFCEGAVKLCDELAGTGNTPGTVKPIVIGQ